MENIDDDIVSAVLKREFNQTSLFDLFDITGIFGDNCQTWTDRVIKEAQEKTAAGLKPSDIYPPKPTEQCAPILKDYGIHTYHY